MKKFQSIALIVAFMIFAVSGALAQKETGAKEVKLQSSFHCEGGKAKIENKLKTMDGVVNVSADVTTKIVTVKYIAQKITPEQLVAAINELGYETYIEGQGKPGQGNAAAKPCNHGNDPNHDHGKSDPNHKCDHDKQPAQSKPAKDKTKSKAKTQ